MKGRTQSSSVGRQAPPAQRGPSRRNIDPQQQAQELEDLLGVARDRHERREPTRNTAPPPPRYQPAPPPPRYVPPASRSSVQVESPYQQKPANQSMSQDDEAIVLIRAMINAAKADGRVTNEEQQGILSRIADPSQETINFLRTEFAAPLDVRDFAWSVPLGMEQQVYTLSLAAIDLDTNAEAHYLRELAHGLRLEPEVCNQINRRYGAPDLF